MTEKTYDPEKVEELIALIQGPVPSMLGKTHGEMRSIRLSQVRDLARELERSANEPEPAPKVKPTPGPWTVEVMSGYVGVYKIDEIVHHLMFLGSKANTATQAGQLDRAERLRLAMRRVSSLDMALISQASVMYGLLQELVTEYDKIPDEYDSAMDQMELLAEIAQSAREILPAVE